MNNKYIENTPTKPQKHLESNILRGVENNVLRGTENLSDYQKMRNLTECKPQKVDNDYISVKKWIDYSSKYGIGYILNNNSYGVFFNDSTKILSLTEEAFFYI